MAKSEIQSAREIVCYNQGELAQYFLIASMLHRNLKEKITSSEYDLALIKSSKEVLVDYLNRNLKRICEYNFERLKKYFKPRHDVTPRICVKATYKNNIVELFRDSAVGYYSSYSIESNTGFKFVRDEGKYYLNNNIPKSYFGGEYINPRLNSDISAYSKQNEWALFWNSNNDVDISSFYKSTLIVPMTLSNNQLSDLYRHLTGIDNEERTIYGFLCIDHVASDYFNEDSDIDIGYIVADLLSLYLINRLNYTKSSVTFGRAKTLLSEGHEDSEGIEIIRLDPTSTHGC